MRAISGCCLIAGAAAALAACGPSQAERNTAISEGFRVVMQMLRDDLAEKLRDGGTFTISDAWSGRASATCGVVSYRDERPPARFIQRYGGPRRQEFMVEGIDAWDQAEWATKCGIRVNEIMPDKLQF